MTEQQLKQITTILKYDETLELFNKYDITTPKRQAMFLSQCSHESGNFKVTKENLNYSKDGLLKVFGKYFKNRDVTEYARNPEKIANLVYANRMGNGDESSGDGFRYRGRGYIQLTGKDNYLGFCKFSGRTLNDETLNYLETPEGALESALYFWNRENLNKFADLNDVKSCTKRINGGYNGLLDREEKYKKFLEILES